MASANTNSASSFCGICRELYSESTDETVCAIPCGHIYHELCLKTWFRNKTSCPECRRPTRSHQIFRLFSNVPTPSPIGVPSPQSSSSQSRDNIQQTMSERSRLLNQNVETSVRSAPQISIRLRLSKILSMLFTHENFNGESYRKVYSTLAVQSLLTLGLLMLMTFHYGSKQLICENHQIIIFAICFICFFICCIASSVDEITVEGNGSVVYLLVFTVGNIWNLEPCLTTMYPFNTLMFAIGFTICIAMIFMKIASEMQLNLTTKEEVLYSSLFVLIVCFIILVYFAGEDLVVWYILQSLFLFICCVYLMMFTEFTKENTHDGPREYITIATGLYVSIINILIFTLRILGGAHFPDFFLNGIVL